MDDVAKKNVPFYLYIYIFYLIYSPQLGNSNIFNPRIVFAILFALQIIFLIIKRDLSLMKLLSIKRNFYFVLTTLFLTFYFVIIALINGYTDLRIFQSLMPIIYLSLILILNNKLNKYDINKRKILYQLAVFQGVTCLLMLIFPSLKQLALDLYYHGGEENIFISSKRIFGISYDYTYATPIYHGILIGLCLDDYLKNKNIKYMLYIPFIFIAIILNGRTGMIIATISTIMVLIFSINKKNFLKILKLSLIFVFLLSMIIVVLKQVAPSTYYWLENGIKSIFNYFLGKDITDSSLTTLTSNNFIHFPKGIKFIFGEGHRVYGAKFGVNNSDIGIVNYIYMGGIVYFSILCINYLKLFRLNGEKSIMFLIYITLIIGIIKGEILNSGIFLTGLMYITKTFEEENVNEKRLP